MHSAAGMRWRALVPVSFIVLSVGASARAAGNEAEGGATPVAHQPHKSSPRTLLLEGAAGVGCPLGWLGASLLFSPIEPLLVHGGVGLGTQGPQFAAGARGRIRVVPKTWMSIGGSWSTGEYAGIDAGAVLIPEMSRRSPPIYFWDTAHFANLEVSVEHDAGSFIVRPFVGVGYVLNGKDGYLAGNSCAMGECEAGLRARLVPFFGFAFAFGVL